MFEHVSDSSDKQIEAIEEEGFEDAEKRARSAAIPAGECSGCANGILLSSVGLAWNWPAAHHF